jgi:uncharacterized protein with HEPN domain
VQDIVDACTAIANYTAGKTLLDFEADPMLQDAVARRLFVIGEAVKSLSSGFKAGVPLIDWRNIGRLRDKLAHHYWSIATDKIWQIVEQHLPSVKQALEKHPILKA